MEFDTRVSVQDENIHQGTRLAMTRDSGISLDIREPWDLLHPYSQTSSPPPTNISKGHQGEIDRVLMSNFHIGGAEALSNCLQIKKKNTHGNTNTT